jgi:hypothetical protein
MICIHHQGHQESRVRAGESLRVFALGLPGQGRPATLYSFVIRNASKCCHSDPIQTLVMLALNTESGHAGMSNFERCSANEDWTTVERNFRFALLEHRPLLAADELILRREAFWKRLLLTRGDQGFNRN